MADKNRRIITLPYGEGLQRSTGVMVVRATSFDDIRNMFLFEGKAQVRQGFALKSILQDDVPSDLDVTIMLAPFRSEAQSVGVGYDSVTKELWLNRLDIDGTNPTVIDSLGTLDGGITFDPPIIVGADSDNKFFFAHDEPNPTSRLVTQVFDPADFPQIQNLTANLDGNGEQDVFFRGVVRHLSYIFGWGFGSASDPVRGDVVRVSNSGDSKIFEDFAFFEAGQQGETVMVCRSAGPTLMVYKETETYEIFGYSPDTFGIRLADSLFGCVGSRLAVSVAGTVFFWSTQGPRITTGGPSVDIAVPLDIDGPDPATLVAESDPQNAFAEYDPRTRVVQFVWGQRVYALSIRDPKKPRWSYYELGETAQCAGLFFLTQSTAGGGGPPIGAPEILTFDEEARGTLTFTGNALNGETVLVNDKTYTWQTVLTDVNGNVQIGATPQDSADNLIAAITLTGTPGVDYAASMTINTDMTAGPALPPSSPLLTVEASGRLGEGFAGNGKPLQETMTNGQWDTSVTKNGIGKSATFFGIKINNNGQIGAEDIEVHLSTDGGVGYSLSGFFPADGLFPEPQFINITLESQSTGKTVQPLTDYKVSMRYRLGGEFSPGYGSSNPDDWPAVSQGTTETTSERITLLTRLGNNGGIWDRRQDDETRWTTSPVAIAPGHEDLDIEVFLEVVEVDEDPDQFSGDQRGDPRLPDQLQRTYNSTDPFYPDNVEITAELVSRPSGGFKPGLNLYRFRYSKGSNKGIFSTPLEVFGGPDMPLRNSLNSFTVFRVPFINRLTIDVSWSNATGTPNVARVCPPGSPAPQGHSTEIWLRNASLGNPWELVGTADHFDTRFNQTIGVFPHTFGNVIRCAVRHSVLCFSPGFPTFGHYDSEWSLNDATPNYIETIVPTP